MPRKTLVAAVVGAALLAGAGIGVGAAFLSGKHAASSHRIAGYTVNRAVPATQLVDQAGKPTSLAHFRGKVVVMSPFLSLCSEVCPLTTGAFLRLRQAVESQGLGDKVVFAEVTVDPWRDSPARLRAYANLTRAHFELLTGSRKAIAAVWRFFGIGYRRVPQGKPPSVDWWTHKPETFDVEHTDGVFFIDAQGRERIFMIGMASVGGRLSPALKGLLSPTGLQNLRHPMGAWTVDQALTDLGELLGRRLSSP